MNDQAVDVDELAIRGHAREMWLREQGRNRFLAVKEREGDSRECRLLTMAQLMAQPDPVWALEGLMPEVGVGQIFGPSGKGKTFVTLDLALSLVFGRESWFGHKISRPGPVIYCAQEGGFDFKLRVQAWMQAHSMQWGASGYGFWSLIEESLDLGSQESLNRLSGDIEVAGIAPVLVVVDTQGLATPGRDENSPTVMNEVFGNMKRFAQRHGAFVLTVHHTGHDETRTRGASSQIGAADLLIHLSEGRFQATKIKAAAGGASHGFKLEPVGQSAVAREMSAAESLHAVFSDQALKRSKVVKHVERCAQCSKECAAQAIGGRITVARVDVQALIDDGTLVRSGKRIALGTSCGTALTWGDANGNG